MKRKVLIVDDMRSNRMILNEMLKSDFDVLEASNGKEALDILIGAGDELSAVLLDISMPVMDGYEAVRRIRSDARLLSLPVIMITGSEDEEPRVKSLALGANDYVTKPYNRDIIKHCLHNHIAFHEAEATVESLQRDKLTGLWNREAFFERATEMIHTNTDTDYCLSCFDIENFKLINDRYGTEKGNTVLRNIADVLRQSCNDRNALCGRISADNFVVLFPISSIYNGVADDRFKKISSVNSLSLHTVISAGRYLITDRTLSVSAMYDRAKIAQATVKHRSDIHVAIYDESMREKILFEQSIINDMRTALAERQFEAWFQPQYNYESGAMIGAEALVRWRHPERGLIPPGVFIPLFEQNGFVYELDKYVWEEVCRCLRKWLDEGRNPLPVSVNISRYDILRPDLTSYIVSLIGKYSLSCDILRLEITESAFSSDADKIIDVVKEFIRLGFTVEIDDFGSGYSSLNTLKDVPAQILKLDMKFLQGGDSERGGNIVESVIRMAKWLGMSVIAEGVETAEQANYLCSIGCIYIQGYLLAKPMPIQQYENHCRHITKEEHLIKLHTVDSLNNNKFWDPESLDSLIFSSYVGAACIFEYSSGKIEVLRGTPLYMQLLGDNITLNDMMKLDISDYLSAKDNKKVLAMLTESIEHKNQITDELVLTGLPGCSKELHIRCTLRVIATAGSSMLVYCLNENVTKQRLAERDMLEADEQIRFLNEMSHELLAHPETDAGINSVLNRLLDYFKGNRAYIFEYDQSDEIVINTYEVCAKGVSAEIDNLQSIPASLLSHWFEGFTRHGFYAIDDISKLCDERADEKRILQAQGIDSLFASPICRDGEIIGLIGIDDPKIKIELVSRFSSLGDYLAVMLTRRDLNKQIESDTKTLADMMGDMPGGFARIRIYSDGTCNTEYVNDGLCKMLGMTRESVIGMYTGIPSDFVHPGDIASLLSEYDYALSSDGQINTTLRLHAVNGSYVWVQLFMRITRADTGDALAYCYCASLSVAQKNELTVRETTPFILSAIMKSSPNLDFAKDSKLKYICCSPAFARFAGQADESGVIGKTDDELFPPETAEQFRSDDKKLFESGKSLVDYTERIPSSDGVQHYSLTSKYILRNETGEIIGLYGTGRDITEDRNTSEQLKLLMNSIPGGVARYAITPGNIKITYYNDGFCKLLGLTREEYEQQTDKTVSSSVFSEDLPLLTEQVNALYKYGTPINCVFRAALQNKNEYVMINICGEVSERTGDTCYVNAVFYDVTARYEAERREHEAAEQIRLITDNMNSGVAAITIDDYGKLSYVFTNNQYYALFGYTKQQYEAEVTDPYEALTPEESERTRNILKRVVSTGQKTTYEYGCRKRDGSYARFRCNAACTSMPGVELTVLLCVISDITEIVNTRLAALKNAEQLQTMMNDTPGGFARMTLSDDGVMRTVFVNEPFCRMRGFNAAEIYEQDGSDALTSVHPDDRETLRSVLAELVRSGKVNNAQYRLRHSDGTFVPVNVLARITSDSDGKTYINAYYTDMTEREKHDYDQRSVMSRTLSAIMKSSNDYSFAKDDSYRYICCSQAFLDFAGVDDEKDIIGKTDYELFPEETAKQFRINDTVVINSGKPMVDFNETVYDRNAKLHFCRASKYVLHGADGEVIGLYGVSRDITSEHSAYEQLKLLTDSIPGGIAVYKGTPDALDKIKLTYFSDGFCSLFGYTRAEYEVISSVNPLGLVSSDIREMYKNIIALVRDGVTMDYIYRAKTNGGGLKWINVKAVLGECIGGELTVNAVFFDVTEQKNTLERLRMSEEESAFAVKHGGNMVCRYTIADRTLSISIGLTESLSMPETLTDVPCGPIRDGMISPETAVAYTDFFKTIIKGGDPGTVLFRQKYSGQWTWTEAKSSIVYSDDGKPFKAIISMFDVSDRIEKEMVYKHWQQTLNDLSPESHSLYRVNLNNDKTSDIKNGSLIAYDFIGAGNNFNERARAYASQCVLKEDRELYTSFMNRDIMFADYYTGKRKGSIEYRELLSNGDTRWVKLTADLVESPDSTDIEAFLLYEDIDEAKRAELETKELSELDSLTGILNRAAFISRVDRVLSSDNDGLYHALLMIDIDGFKMVNDVFGHSAGDRALAEIAGDLQSAVRGHGYVGRIGGDEFVAFLSDIRNEDEAVAKAAQICSLTRKSFSHEVQISCSIGVVIAPRDGTDFMTLYKKADSALYYVKGSGKDNMAVYSSKMEGEHLELEEDEQSSVWSTPKKRRMFIIDDNSIDYTILKSIFNDNFIIETANDGAGALIRMRHYGSAISVVLLDMMMPGMDGFTVLEKMQENEELRSVPVIIVSGDDSREMCLRAIRCGASDFITKPVDAELLKIRVDSAVSRAENDQLRAKNTLLELRNEERVRLDYAMSHTGIVFMGYNPHFDEFTYNSPFSECIAGRYDERCLWDILLADSVADADTVAEMKALTEKVAIAKSSHAESMVVTLKTPAGELHCFRMNVHKPQFEEKLKGNILISFCDLDYKQ